MTPRDLLVRCIDRALRQHSACRRAELDLRPSETGLSLYLVMRRHLGLSRIHVYVTAVAAIAVVLVALASQGRDEFPGWWPFVVLALVSFLLEVSSTRLRGGGAEGSISFVVHLAAFVLFGGFWAACIVVVSTLAGQLANGRAPTRIVFNTSQRVISVLVAAGTYLVFKGQIPLSLFASTPATFEFVVRDLAAFLIAVVTYILANSVAVSGAVAISNGRSFSSVWKTNTLWVLGYDVGASGLSLIVAWVYSVFDRPEGLMRLGFLVVFLPIIVAKHIYGKLNTLQGLYDELDRAHERLEENVREQLAMMVKSIEARDPYTSGHSRRVAALSRAIAIDFGLSSELVDEIESAALLHDVGKIHAEFAPLLSKEGKLTPEEWEVMKTHAAKSAELVGLFSRFKGHVQDSVRNHHERWDGLGYPDGIQGDSIPLGARVIMISDTIDAMTTDRPYRKALGFDVVIAELLKHKGTQFDPRLVENTINSVTVRRIASQPQLPDTEAAASGKKAGAVPLRSHGSFFAALRRGGAT